MKKLLLCSAMAIALVGCAPGGGVDLDKLKQILGQVQDAANSACSFIPTVDTILAIINLNDPNLQNASQIAKAVCDAIKPPAAGDTSRRASDQPKIKDVIIKGYDVKK